MTDMSVRWEIDAFDVGDNKTRDQQLIAACEQAYEAMHDPSRRHAYEVTMSGGETYLVDFYEVEDVSGNPTITPVMKPLSITEADKLSNVLSVVDTLCHMHEGNEPTRQVCDQLATEIRQLVDFLVDRQPKPPNDYETFHIASGDPPPGAVEMPPMDTSNLELRLAAGYASLDEGHDCDPGCRGWDLFDSNRGWQVQRCDSCARFEDDIAAIDYVLNHEEDRKLLIQRLQGIDAPTLSGEETLCKTCRNGIGLPRGCSHGLELTKCEFYRAKWAAGRMGTKEGAEAGARIGNVAGIVEFLQRNNIEAEHLDGAMDEEKSKQRADINNGGLDAQVEYLLEHNWTEAEILLAAGDDAGRTEELVHLCLCCGKTASLRTAHRVNKDDTNQWCCEACWDPRLA